MTPDGPVIEDISAALGSISEDKVLYARYGVPYLIRHCLKGTTTWVAQYEEGCKKIGETLTATAATKFREGYESAKFSYFDKNPIEITPNEKENIITVYYEIPLTITAKNAEKTYDGQPLTQSDFEVTGLVGNDTKERITLSMTADSTITNAGSHANVIDPATVKVPPYHLRKDGERLLHAG